MGVCSAYQAVYRSQSNFDNFNKENNYTFYDKCLRIGLRSG